MEELQERLAEAEVERDEALARCRRRDAQLIELAESQRTMQEHAQIISAKYQRAKTEIEQMLARAARRIYAATHCKGAGRFYLSACYSYRGQHHRRKSTSAQ